MAEAGAQTGYVARMRAAIGHDPLLLVAAGVIVLDHGGRLLLQRRSDDGTWGLPGGGLEPDEDVADCARRELREETGLVAGDLELVCVRSGRETFLVYPNGDRCHVVSVLYRAQSWSGELSTGDPETLALGFFAPDDLPEMNPFNAACLADPVVRRALGPAGGVGRAGPTT